MSSATSRGCQSFTATPPPSGPDASRGDRLEQVEPAEVGAQGLGDPDRAVLLLVGLQQRDDRPVGRAQGAVEGRDRADLAVLEATPRVEPTGLEVGAVGGRGELAEAALRGDPGLAVELPLCRESEVAGGHVDHAVAELELVEEL